MDPDDLITIDPEIQQGQPVFKGTQVPIEILFEYIDNGSNIDEFMEQFPGISREQIKSVMELGRSWLTGPGMGYPWSK